MVVNIYNLIVQFLLYFSNISLNILKREYKVNVEVQMSRKHITLLDQQACARVPTDPPLH